MADFSDRDDDPLADGVERGAQRFEEAEEAASAAALRIKGIFSEVGGSIENSLERAARSGELSFRRIAEAALQAFASDAIQDLFRAAIAPAGQALLSQVPFLGARADGGPVTPGGAFLVGERGPELFAPTSAGEVTPLGAPVTVNINITGDRSSEMLTRSRGQIATAVARAVARGQRRL